MIPGLEGYPGGEHGNPLQYSCLEDPHGQRSLAGCSLWGRKEPDMTEQLSTAQRKKNQQRNTAGETGRKSGKGDAPETNRKHYFKGECSIAEVNTAEKLELKLAV